MAPNDNHLWTITITTNPSEMNFLNRYVHLHKEIEQWYTNYDKMVRPKCYIASVGERIVGFMLSHLSVYNNHFAFDIDYMYVSKSYRGQGVASSLLKKSPRISIIRNPPKEYDKLFWRNGFVKDFLENFIKF
jgi:hypothetical protein